MSERRRKSIRLLAFMGIGAIIFGITFPVFVSFFSTGGWAAPYDDGQGAANEPLEDNIQWEKVKAPTGDVWRTCTPLGWLVIGKAGQGNFRASFVTYVPDPEHEWEAGGS